MSGFWKLENKYGLYSNVFRESGVFMKMKFKAFKIMKTITILFFTILVVMSCKSKDMHLIPTDNALQTNPLLLSKWQPQYYIPYNSNDNTWGKAKAVDSLSKTFIIEFTKDSQFLINGKPGGGCCYAGDKYSAIENEISFPEPSYKGCQSAYCRNCGKWAIEKVDEQTLILEECNNRKIQYVKTK
jgi:hypothetical protein